MAFREEHLSNIGFSVNVGFTYKGRQFAVSFIEDAEELARFLFSDAQEYPPRQEDVLQGTLEPSDTMAARIVWDGEIPSDIIIVEAMDTIVGYMVERKHLTVRKK